MRVRTLVPIFALVLLGGLFLVQPREAWAPPANECPFCFMDSDAGVVHLELPGKERHSPMLILLCGPDSHPEIVPLWGTNPHGGTSAIDLPYPDEVERAYAVSLRGAGMGREVFVDAISLTN